MSLRVVTIPSRRTLMIITDIPVTTVLCRACCRCRRPSGSDLDWTRSWPLDIQPTVVPTLANTIIAFPPLDSLDQDLDATFVGLPQVFAKGWACIAIGSKPFCILANHYEQHGRIVFARYYQVRQFPHVFDRSGRNDLFTVGALLVA